MRLLLGVLFLLVFSSNVYAQWSYDYHGHRTKTENLWKDRDGDGTPNYYDVRDDDPKRQ